MTNNEIVQLHELARSDDVKDRDYAYYQLSNCDWETVQHVKSIWRLVELTNNLTGAEH